MSTSSVTVTTNPKGNKSRRRNLPQRAAKVRVVANTNTQRSIRRRRRATRSSNLTLNPSSTVEDKWLKCLNDPFENGPVKLGIGTLVPTFTATAYSRVTVNANADGSFALFCYPAVGTTNRSIWYNNSGFASTTWTGAAFINEATIAASFHEARIIGYGIRALPLVAATAVPGLCYSGAYPTAYVAGLTGGNIGAAQSPTCMSMSLATNGAVATGRPQDPNSFIFYGPNITGPTSSTNSDWSVPSIIFTGLPASTPIICEIIMHLECMAGTTESLVNMAQDLRTGESSVPSRFQTVESMFNYIRPRLLPESVANFALENLRNLGSNLARGAFNLSAQYLTNSLNQRARRRNRQVDNGYLMIEEVD